DLGDGRVDEAEALEYRHLPRVAAADIDLVLGDVDRPAVLAEAQVAVLREVAADSGAEDGIARCVGAGAGAQGQHAERGG
ncbi:hypothetical protein DKP78_19285, partial [Enterococcus faecium]